MNYFEILGKVLLLIANVAIAVVAVMVLAYTVYRCFPRRIRCKITRRLKAWSK